MEKVIIVKRDDITGEQEEVSKTTALDIFTRVFTAPEQVLETLLINDGNSFSVQAESSVFSTVCK